MWRIFVDASVFFSACYSQTGASYEIFRLALQGAAQLITSDYIVQEIQRNLSRKSPDDLPRFKVFLGIIGFEYANPSAEEVLKSAEFTELKDAPVVAAALSAGADFLVSLDRRHLVGQTRVSEESGIQIILPEELLRLLRNRKLEE